MLFLFKQIKWINKLRTLEQNATIVRTGDRLLNWKKNIVTKITILTLFDINVESNSLSVIENFFQLAYFRIWSNNNENRS